MLNGRVSSRGRRIQVTAALLGQQLGPGTGLARVAANRIRPRPAPGPPVPAPPPPLPPPPDLFLSCDSGPHLQHKFVSVLLKDQVDAQHQDKDTDIVCECDTATATLTRVSVLFSGTLLFSHFPSQMMGSLFT